MHVTDEPESLSDHLEVWPILPFLPESASLGPGLFFARAQLSVARAAFDVRRLVR
jgi:hypothetical protein